MPVAVRHREAHDESSIEERYLLRRGNLFIRRMLIWLRHCEAHDEFSNGKEMFIAPRQSVY